MKRVFFWFGSLGLLILMHIGIASIYIYYHLATKKQITQNEASIWLYFNATLGSILYYLLGYQIMPYFLNMWFEEIYRSNKTYDSVEKMEEVRQKIVNQNMKFFQRNNYPIIMFGIYFLIFVYLSTKRLLCPSETIDSYFQTLIAAFLTFIAFEKTYDRFEKVWSKK